MFDTVTAVSPWTVPAAQRTRLIGGALMVHLVAAAAYLAATIWSIAPVAPPDLGSVFVVEPAPPQVTFVEPARREPAANPTTAGAPAEVAQPVAATVQPREIGELEPATPGLERIATLGGPEGSVAADGGTTGPVASGYGVGELSVEFQVATGRMPLQNQGPQAPQKSPQFTEDQIKAMAAWVQSVAPGPTYPDERILDGEGNLTEGAELFRINCAMCHNVAAAGGALTEGKYAPALTKTSPLHIYAAMVTGPQNMPVFNDMTITPDEKRDIISSLMYLQKSEPVGGFTLGSLGPVSEGLFIWIFGIGTLIGISVWITAKSN